MKKIIQLELTEDEASFIVMSMYLSTLVIYRDEEGIIIGDQLIRPVYEKLDGSRLCLIADAISKNTNWDKFNKK